MSTKRNRPGFSGLFNAFALFNAMKIKREKLVSVDTFSSLYCSSKWNSKHGEWHKIEMKPVSFLFFGEALNLEHFARDHMGLVLMMKESIEFADSTQMKRR